MKSDYPVDTYADTVLSSPPAEATKMVGDRDQEQILICEANRPLTDEECAIVDAGYERGKRILAEVKAEERERRLVDAVQAFVDMNEVPGMLRAALTK